MVVPVLFIVSMVSRVFSHGQGLKKNIGSYNLVIKHGGRLEMARNHGAFEWGNHANMKGLSSKTEDIHGCNRWLWIVTVQSPDINIP